LRTETLVQHRAEDFSAYGEVVQPNRNPFNRFIVTCNMVCGVSGLPMAVPYILFFSDKKPAPGGRKKTHRVRGGF
jgi:hypothetical protein